MNESKELRAFCDAAEALREHWTDKLNRGYPPYLPDFDEFLIDLALWARGSQPAVGFCCPKCGAIENLQEERWVEVNAPRAVREPCNESSYYCANCDDAYKFLAEPETMEEYGLRVWLFDGTPFGCAIGDEGNAHEISAPGSPVFVDKLNATLGTAFALSDFAFQWNGSGWEVTP